MSKARIVSVNVGQPRALPDHPSDLTSIDKRPVTGPVRARTLGLEGDSVSDLVHHGGIEQAVYAYASEDYARWAELLGEALRPGLFGENLTTIGLDLNRCVVGEQWSVGEAVLEVRSVRVPCNTFKRWLGHEGLDNAGWVRRFTEEGRAGVYLAVRQEGDLAAGDDVRVSGVPVRGLETGTMFRAFTTRRDLLPGLLDLPGLPQEAYDKAHAYGETSTGE